MEKTHHKTSSLPDGWQLEIIQAEYDREQEKPVFHTDFSGPNDQMLGMKWLKCGHKPGDMLIFHIKCHCVQFLL